MCGREPPTAYLIQSAQSRDHPVPLVAGKEALLRVFVTASKSTNEGIPPVRALLYLDGSESYRVTIPCKSTAIPTGVEEGSLAKSANAAIPARFVQPGLEIVIEVDPEGTLDDDWGVVERIPEEGRLAIDVRAPPPLDLTLIPFLWEEDPDSSVLEATEEMAREEEEHELFHESYDLLPIGELEVSRHSPVESSSNDAYDLLAQVRMIRTMEGGAGHYQGLMSGSVTGAGGPAYRPGRTSFSVVHEAVIAHELGHNLSIRHPPCGGALGPDASFPQADGTIGGWGYDSRSGTLLPPGTFDIMSNCDPTWISDYYFANALRFRLTAFDHSGLPSPAAAVRSILLWGGVDAEGELFLKPAFVVDAVPELPSSSGSFSLTGRDQEGAELFRITFDMDEVADGDGTSTSFAFLLPARPAWANSLASVILAGPEGPVTLDGDTNAPMTILQDARSGQVRAIWEGLRSAPALPPSFELLLSRGMPGREAWER